MKRILYFIGLKIGEVLGVFFTYYLSCWGWIYLEKFINWLAVKYYIYTHPIIIYIPKTYEVYWIPEDMIHFWVGGLVFIWIICIFIFVIGRGLLAWIFANWEKAGKLSE